MEAVAAVKQPLLYLVAAHALGIQDQAVRARIC